MRKTSEDPYLLFYWIKLAAKHEYLSLDVTCGLHIARTEEINYQSSLPSQLQIQIQIFRKCVWPLVEGENQFWMHALPKLKICT
jgi:hypothetical protein